MTTNDPTTTANILLARTLHGVPPDSYNVGYANFADLLATRAHGTPDALFLRYHNDDTGQRADFTFGDTYARASQIANYLANELGVTHGERVATLAFNHPDTALIYLACWMIGAVVAPQNSGEDDTRIGFILGNAEARVVLAHPDYAERARAICTTVAGVTLVPLDSHFSASITTQPPTFTPIAQATLEDEALLVYTSGTTGAPKGVQLTQGNLLVDAQAIVAWHGLDSSTRLMGILPIHHVNGIVVTLVTPLYVGCTTVLNRGFKVSTFWQRIAEERINIVSVVPTILQFLCEAGTDITRLDLSTFRYAICGAGTLPVALAQRFESQFATRVLHGYGLSETTCYSCFLPIDLDGATHAHWMSAHGYPSIGCPIAANEMSIHDPDGVDLPDGERGEIVARGHNVMTGYFKRPDANAETFAHGWFRSGDEGFQLHDQQGRQFFFITGRLKELINRGGVKYSPFEIEELLLQIPGVRVGLAIAFDNAWYGEEVGAYIVREEDSQLSEDEVLQYCRTRMPFAKAPKVVVFGDEIPVTVTGKYQRMRLKPLFTAWAETQFRS